MRNIIVPSLVSPSTADWQRVSTLTAVTIEREREREREGSASIGNNFGQYGSISSLLSRYIPANIWRKNRNHLRERKSWRVCSEKFLCWYFINVVIYQLLRSPGPSLRAAAQSSSKVLSQFCCRNIYGVGWPAGRLDGPAVAQQKDWLTDWPDVYLRCCTLPGYCLTGWQTVRWWLVRGDTSFTTTLHPLLAPG